MSIETLPSTFLVTFEAFSQQTLTQQPSTTIVRTHVFFSLCETYQVIKVIRVENARRMPRMELSGHFHI